jgi:hypothetical protein
LVVLVSVYAFSCKKNTEIVNIKTDFSYYPQISGSFFIYKVQEIKIDAPSNYYDTTNYLLKEYFTYESTDNSGDICFRIERYQRANDTLPWQVKNIWTSKFLGNSVVRTEENVSYVKLLFPAVLNKTWNGNQYNTGDFESYRISGIDNKELINNNEYGSVLTVIQRDDENLIEKHYSVEKYGKNTGLLLKQDINITSMYVIPGEPYYKRIKTGTIYFQQILSFFIQEDD